MYPQTWPELFALDKDDFDTLTSELAVDWSAWAYELLPNGDDDALEDTDLSSANGRIEIVGHILGLAPLTQYPSVRNINQPGAMDATGSLRVHGGMVVDNQSGEMRPAVERVHGPRNRRTGAVKGPLRKPTNGIYERPYSNAG